MDTTVSTESLEPKKPWKAAVAIDRGSLTMRISRTKLAYGLS